MSDGEMIQQNGMDPGRGMWSPCTLWGGSGPASERTAPHRSCRMPQGRHLQAGVAQRPQRQAWPGGGAEAKPC